MNYWQKSIVAILKRGRVPGHISIIMDGNRQCVNRISRYARDHHLPVMIGHQQGFNTFINVLRWAEAIGINEVTVFAFSIENYNRPTEEVDYLMELAKNKLTELSKEDQFFQQHQVRVKVCGNLNYCRPDLRDSLKEVEHSTIQYSKCKLNMCFSYNFTNELETAIQKIPEGLSKEEFLKSLNSNLMIQNRPDILIRTSGETRLSNFMLRQISEDTLIYFVNKRWPEWGFLDFVKMILFFRNQ